jgi:hypothetical protein
MPALPKPPKRGVETETAQEQRDPSHLPAPPNVMQNIEAIADLQGRGDLAPNKHQKFLETVTDFAARPRFVYFVVVFVLL